ncbi:type I-B CRISPR-associated protein Cas5b [Heyndrickxia faecalis]|uniref:CRISPR-associated protein Cas5, Hmari subtype n=2 Tax=Heyndrickxia TaxID=2837504 RepID=A0A133L2P3_HEYCO|nr:type I-B CRISPR-associated protein Cas5b [Heyndrickxia coagulans]KWZ86199.1 CRISPR-associated protein Cas5, Hmari subtype [Heyndrickxia coagulans]
MGILRALAFELRGRTAFFKKPDVNANIYFTYSHIHKIALLGMLGAILGLKGYEAQSRDIKANGDNEANRYPEFYEKLKDLKVSIVPHGDRGYFSKKIQVFNNSVGYASFEQGQNLIIKEQWLENPHWTVYLLDDGTEICMELFNRLKSHQSVYLPYLGKNDHPASITKVREVELENAWAPGSCIDSLFCSKGVDLGRSRTEPYLYQEFLPIKMDDILNSYVFEQMFFTNQVVNKIQNSNVIYCAEEKNLFFF